MYIIKTDCSGKMVAAFTIRKSYLMVSVFCHICGIKFLIWLRHWSGFRHSDKSGYSRYIQLSKLLWLWFYVDFILNLGFYYNAVEYRHKYHNRQYINIRKNPCFIVYMTASPAETPLVTLGLRVSIKPALPIRFLYEE